MDKTIILFYSFEGNTKKVSEYLASELNLPYQEIKPINNLDSKGFRKYFWGGSQVIMKKKPELENIEIDLAEYENVLLGSPIWAGCFTPVIRTLLEEGILKDKKIAFFYCHDGGPGKAEIKIEEAVKINNRFISSYGLNKVKDNFDSLKDEILDWAKRVEDIMNKQS